MTVLVEIFKFFNSVRALQLHPLVVRMRLFQVVFSHFSPSPKKSAKVRARSRSELAAHSSSSTPGASGVVSSLEEPVQEEEEHQDAQEEEEENEVPVLESAEWVQSRDPTGKTYNWNRRTFTTSWKPPLDTKVVWVGETTKEGGVWYWHKVTRASTYTLPPLPPE